MLNKNFSVSSFIGIAAVASGFLAFPSQSSAITFTSVDPVTIGVDGAADFNPTNASRVSIVVTGQPENIFSLNSVTISGLLHNNYSDLTILIQKSGFSNIFLTLSSLDGGVFPAPPNTLNGTYTFVPTSGANWYAGGNPLASGNYNSTNSMGTYNGTVVEDTYTLMVFDRVGNASGAANFTGFSFDVTPVPFEFEASAGVAILGGAWLMRKRLLNKKKSEELS